MSRSRPADLHPLVPDGLRSIELPTSTSKSTKHERGRVLIVGGSAETPGAVLLAATAAMRVGAGVVQIATAAHACAALAVALPETRVIALDDRGPSSALHDDDGRLAVVAEGADAVLVGSGTFDTPSTRLLLSATLAGVSSVAVVVVDAAALDVVGAEPGLLHAVAQRAVLMPNIDEAARLTQARPEVVADDPCQAVDRIVDRLGTVVAVRGPETWISAPRAPHVWSCAGHPLLGVAGSGDVLAGVLVGLAAHGFAPMDATLAAVHLHARAGERLAERGPGVGRLARELLDELPTLVEELTELVEQPP